MRKWVGGLDNGQEVWGRVKLEPQGTKKRCASRKGALFPKIWPLAPRLGHGPCFFAKRRVCVCFFSVASMKGAYLLFYVSIFACGWALEIALSTLYSLMCFVLQVACSGMVPSLVVKILT